MFAAFFGDYQEQFLLDLQGADSDFLACTTSVPLSAFLVALWRSPHQHLLGQIAGQLATLIDDIVPDRGPTANPLDIVEDGAAIPRHVRHDRRLDDTLALGEGCGSAGQRVKHPTQHMVSYCMFTPEAKRPRKLDPTDPAESILLRLVQTSEGVMSRVRYPSLSTDGVRVSGKDVYYSIVSGAPDNGEFISSWDVKVVWTLDFPFVPEFRGLGLLVGGGVGAGVHVRIESYCKYGF